jgi:hypothetical protein
MRILSLLRWVAGVFAALAATLAMAGNVLVAFPEFNGAPVTLNGPFPQPAQTVATRTFTIPEGERVVSAYISGYWGSSVDPDSTAGVEVKLDGYTVASCNKPDPGCYTGDQGRRQWSHTLTEVEMSALNDGTATLTVVQTSDVSVRLGVTTLYIETGVPPSIPALSPLSLLALLAGMAAAGALALQRRSLG